MKGLNRPRVIIVGAGPAGSATACHLARAGIDCLLIDRKAFPRDKVCGDCLSPRAQQQLDRLGLLEAVAAESHVAPGIRFQAPNGGASQTSQIAADGLPNRTLVIPRLRFDHLLQQEALRLGARFRQGSVRTLIDRQGRTLKKESARKVSIGGVILEGESIQADWVVLATGAAQPLLNQAGLGPPGNTASRAARLYAHNLPPQSYELQFFFDQMPLPGYAWLFPTGPTSANLGFWHSGNESIHAPSALMEFIQHHPGLHARLGDQARLDTPRGHPIRTDFLSCRKSTDGVFCVGEAAGLVNPFTGEGIDYALESGALAALAIQNLIQRTSDGRPSEAARHQARKCYEISLDKHFRQLFLLMALAQRWGFRPGLFNRLFGQGLRHQALIDNLIQVCFGAAPPSRLIRPKDLMRLLHP